MRTSTELTISKFKMLVIFDFYKYSLTELVDGHLHRLRHDIFAYSRRRNYCGAKMHIDGYARSNRSAFITFVHAVTKSCTNFSLLSS